MPSLLKIIHIPHLSLLNVHYWPLYDKLQFSSFAKNHSNNMDLLKKFGDTIIRLRKERGLSQEKFALDSKVDRRYLSDIENGRRNVSIDVIERLATSFGLSISQLFVEVEKQ